MNIVHEMGVQKCVNAHTYTGVSTVQTAWSRLYPNFTFHCLFWMDSKNKWILQFRPEQINRCSQEGSLDLVIWVTGGGVEQSPLVEKVF